MAKRLLLIGGGHSHVEVIRRLGLVPEPGVAVTLVSPDRHTAYSGMLPGHIAGHYRFDECHIDLDALCHGSGITRVGQSVTAMDAARRIAICANGEELPFDIVSIDTGSVPATANIAGAEHHGVPVKPVAAFLQHWAALRAAAGNTNSLPRIAIVGAGAGGIELALAMQHRICADGHHAQFTILSDTATILPAHPDGVQRRFEHILHDRGIEVRLNAPVHTASSGGLTLHAGAQVPADHVIWATGAAAPAWPRDSGLQTDKRGFIAVNDCLQSPSHACVFAAGDIAGMLSSPRPKSGVYAVRQGPPLAENLRRALRGEPLQAYRPQRTALALISTGNRYAVASYGPLAFGGAWIWRWKNRIDTAFMRRYSTALNAGGNIANKMQ